MYWSPHITVASIVERNGKFLMVEERCNGTVVFNQPAGHLEPDETLAEAAIRETYEETGWHVKPTHVLGVSKYISTAGVTYYRTTFIAEAIDFDRTAALDEGIISAQWLSYEELSAQYEKLRSPLVLKNIDSYLRGDRYPLSLIDDATHNE